MVTYLCLPYNFHTRAGRGHAVGFAHPGVSHDLDAPGFDLDKAVAVGLQCAKGNPCRALGKLQQMNQDNGGKVAADTGSGRPGGFRSRHEGTESLFADVAQPVVLAQAAQQVVLAYARVEEIVGPVLVGLRANLVGCTSWQKPYRRANGRLNRALQGCLVHLFSPGRRRRHVQGAVVAVKDRTAQAIIEGGRQRGALQQCLDELRSSHARS
jgi:hypothetical protein